MLWIIAYFFISSILICGVGFFAEESNESWENTSLLIAGALFLFWGIIVIFIPYFIGMVIYKLDQKRIVKTEEKKLEKVYANPKIRHKA